MINLNCFYGGLNLENPFIVSSSDLTNSVNKIVQLEKAGASAVVLKTLFCGESLQKTEKLIAWNPSNLENSIELEQYLSIEALEKKLCLIQEAKQKCRIPIIASLHCFQTDKWISYAQAIAQAGADAIEINHSLWAGPLCDPSPNNLIELCLLIEKLKTQLSIPITVKLFYGALPIVPSCESLKAAGAAGIVLFNHPYPIDIDIFNKQFIPPYKLSSKEQIYNTLRWIGITSGRVRDLPLAASSGIKEPEDGIKAILAGAAAVQLCSTIYDNGFSIISQMNTYLSEWMNKMGYKSIDDFRGCMSIAQADSSPYYFRTQYMDYSDNR